MITREYLETRIQEFTAARVKYQADVAANTGAIQICTHLLVKLAEEVQAQAEADDRAEIEKAMSESNGEADPLTLTDAEKEAMGEEAGP